MAKKKLSKRERDLLESVRQAERGEFAAVHTPDAIVGRLMLDDDAARQYLCKAFSTYDEQTILAALRHAIHARGMAQLADAAGLARRDVFDALSPGAQPSFATVHRIIVGMGLRLGATPA